MKHEAELKTDVTLNQACLSLVSVLIVLLTFPINKGIFSRILYSDFVVGGFTFQCVTDASKGNHTISGP